MKAIRFHNYGGPEVIRLDDIPRPAPGPGELLIKVHAASVNPVDGAVRQGYMQQFLPLKLPFVPGWDLSGVVETIGAGVGKFKVGDEVIAALALAHNRIGSGSYAEYTIVTEEETAAKPRTLDHVQASTIGVAGLTAWRALFETAQLAAGQKVLIHRAAGGVGTFAVQFAHWKGTHVLGTASTENQEFLRQLGVDQPIDYKKNRFEDVASDVDVVLDTFGGEVQERSWKTLRKGGILVSLVGPPAANQAARHGVRAVFHANSPSATALAEIAKLIDSGQCKVFVDTVLPLAEARRAQEMSATGHIRGKIVLKVA
ncbi:MAG TPA: NADP-dependent oxidoreductase [Gemmataceae bacterium]|nr:NADP-dependent oxidoreductase [Gemmataceae bacterium]